MIRPYSDSDLDQLLDVWYRASVVAHSFLPAEFFESERALIGDEWLPRSETWVFEKGVAVIGFISLVGTEVGGLFVDPDEQGNGIGRSLLDKAATVRPFLELAVFDENTHARHFYERYGFVDVGRSVNAETGHIEIRMQLAKR